MGTESVLSPDKFHTCWNKSSVQYSGVCKRGSGMKFLVTLRIPEIFRCIVAILTLALHSSVILNTSRHLNDFSWYIYSFKKVP